MFKLFRSVNRTGFAPASPGVKLTQHCPGLVGVVYTGLYILKRNQFPAHFLSLALLVNVFTRSRVLLLNLYFGSFIP